MPGRVIPSEDGYTIRGIAPPSLARQSSEVKLMLWGWVIEAGLKQKDRDLSQGLDKDGNLMRISPKTREHRHSAMTPSGKGDPRAPALEPGRKLSRVRSPLTGRAEVDRAEFWWKFDPHIGDSFARILEYQRDEGRDVFGLSSAALKRVMAQSWEKYRRWEQGKPVAMPVPIGVAQAQPIAMAGHAATQYATFGIGRQGAPTGQWSGGMRAEEWVRHFRQPAAATIPQRPKGPYNRLLGHIWGGLGNNSGASGNIPAPPRNNPPTPRPIRRAALKPAPAAARSLADVISYAKKAGHALVEVTSAEMVDRWGYELFEADQIPLLYRTDSRRIHVNTTATTWRADPLEQRRVMGRQYVLPSLESMVDHEIGHLEHHRAIGERIVSPEMLDRGWMPRDTDAEIAELRKMVDAVSAYATTMPVEFVAEVYAGLKGGRAFPPWVLELYESFGGPQAVIVDAQCNRCKHLDRPVLERHGWFQCAAFPAGLPVQIELNQHDHRKPFPGDHGILFEPIETQPFKPLRLA